MQDPRQDIVELDVPEWRYRFALWKMGSLRYKDGSGIRRQIIVTMDTARLIGCATSMVVLVRYQVPARIRQHQQRWDPDIVAKLKTVWEILLFVYLEMWRL